MTLKSYIHRFYFLSQNNLLLRAASFILILIIFITLLAPFIPIHDPVKTDISLRLATPSLKYPFGNDSLGRCMFSRILSGARISIGLGVCIVIFSCVSGVIIGVISGFFGGIIDEIFMRIVDIFFSFPEIVAAMALAGIMGPGLLNLIFALSCVGWMRYARLVRGITLLVKQRDYVKAAQLSGVTKTVIILRHILPANIPSIIVLATLGMAKTILAVSALGFLGFGAQPPLPEWGTLLMEGKDYIISAPHLSLFPGIAIILTTLTLNIVGDGLRDIFETP